MSHRRSLQGAVPVNQYQPLSGFYPAMPAAPAAPAAPDPQNKAAQEILSILIRAGGQLSKKDFVQECLRLSGDASQASYPKMSKAISEIVSAFEGQIFTKEQQGKQEIIRTCTDLALCEHHATKNGCEKGLMCGSLHLCKFFIADSCSFVKGPKSSCLYGHNLRDSHNSRLLKAHSLDLLHDEDIKRLLTQNRSKVTLPRICKFYNVGKGCRAGEGGRKCNALHVCKYYILGDCGFGMNCKRSHNIYDDQPKHLLTKHGIDVQRSPKDVLKELREAMAEASEFSSERKSISSLPNARQRARSRSRTPTRGQPREMHVVKFDDEDPTRPQNGATVPRIRTTSENSGLEDSEEICTYFLRGRCNYGQACRKHHCDMPYQWQYRSSEDNRWIDFREDSNEEIEINFSDPDDDGCFTTTPGLRGEIMKIEFDKMRGQVNHSEFFIRRLSTLSYVNAAPTHIFTTNWKWFWKNEHGRWINYDDHAKLTSPSKGTYSNSRQIEEYYQKNPDGSIDFSTPHNSYHLLLHRMIQKNIRYTTERPVRRRPDLVSRKEVRKLKDTRSEAEVGEVENPSTGPVLQSFETKCPDHWNKQVMKDGSEYQLVPIEKKGRTLKEFKNIEELWQESMNPDSYKIKKITRIQNMELWDKYIRNKNWKNKKSPKDQLEKFLFHGTRDALFPAISQQGFDWRVAGTSVGTLYGKGSYFAKTADFARNYTNCNKLFVVRVLVGDYTIGNSQMVKPPPKDLGQPGGPTYDTCVDNMDNPRMFVVFEQERAYPEYIVEY